MALSAPRVVFGIHSATFYNPLSGLPYGTLRVLGNGTFSMTGTTIELRGGSNRFPWSIQDGNIDAKIDITTREYPDFMMELFLGKAPTAVVSDATGDVNGFVNMFGTSIKNGTNGISAIAPSIGNEASLKFGKLILKAVSANTFDIYGISNVDFARGTDVDFQNDLLKINAAPITAVAGAVTVASLGLEFTVIGIPAFIINDTAVLDVLPIHIGASSAVVGGLADVFPEFGCILLCQQLGSGEMVEIDVFKAKAIGANLGAAEKAFSETPISAKAYFDSAKNGICKITMIKPV